jgi:isopenicillin N synthase-like dioxygenase
MLKMELVIIDYQDLVPSSNLASSSGTETRSSSSPLPQHIESAFGPHGLGIIAIRHVPGLEQAKQDLFPMAHTLAHLPNDYLEEHLTDEASLYNVGWSRGKEMLNGGQPDHSKGSFYYCPTSDTPGSHEERTKYPLSYPTNKWLPPPQHDQEIVLPGFELAAKRLGTLLKEVVVHLARHLDAYCEERVSGYPANTLHDALQDTPKVKARLLYYYPQKHETTTDAATTAPWIGWHHDSGFLTALAGEWYVNDHTGNVITDLEHVPPGAGLYVATTSNGGTIEEHHIVLPPDCMAVQIGECTQIISGGVLVATPHAVISGVPSTTATSINDVAVARISLACFVDTPPSYRLSPPPGCTRQEIAKASHPDPRVPPLSKRWTSNNMTFGDFLRDTFAMYYQWQPPTSTTNMDTSSTWQHDVGRESFS